MKHLFFLIAILSSIICSAQELDPELFQTWYLNSVVVSDGTEGALVVSEINLSSPPSLTIMEDLSFSGVGACNTFTGTFVFSDNLLSTNQFSSTDNDCGIDTLNLFEEEYFGFMELLSGYTINPSDNGLELLAFTPVFGEAYFTNFKLSTKDFNLANNNVVLYPNPTTNVLHLESQQAIKHLSIYDIYGRQIQDIAVIGSKTKIDISTESLSAGTYVVKIKTGTSELIKKIIKE